METSRCFLSTPFSGVFSQVRQAIAEALQNTGVEPVLVEDFPASARSPTDLLQDHIRSATFVIADVTGGNPYVLYEVGFAHAMQKSALLITQDLDSVPSPLKTDYLLFVYELGDLAIAGRGNLMGTAVCQSQLAADLSSNKCRITPNGSAL